LSIAAGREWHGRKGKQSLVVLYAAEQGVIIALSTDEWQHNTSSHGRNCNTVPKASFESKLFVAAHAWLNDLSPIQNGDVA
jgi:hypothetical protein